MALIVALMVPMTGVGSAADTKPPKIAQARMQDLDGDSRADSIVLTYSEKIKHAADSDGKYPFSVPGYTVKKVNKANATKNLTVVLNELGVPDLTAKPSVKYARTTKKPVRDMAGNQAKKQTFVNTASLDLDEDGVANTDDDCDDVAEDTDEFQDTDGCPDPDNDGDGLNDVDDNCDNAAEDTDEFEDTDGCPELDNDQDGTPDIDDSQPNNACVPTPHDGCDPDGDNVSATAGDCAPNDGTIYPGAPDEPDLQGTDQDCDGVDGKEAGAIFVAPSGNDSDPGSKTAPKATMNAAVSAAAASEPVKDVYAAAGQYNQTVNLATGVDIYGAYDATNWSRSSSLETVVTGTPQGALADGDTGVLLQLLTIRGQSPPGLGQSAYGLRAIGGSSVTLQKTKVEGGNATNGNQGSSAGLTPPPGFGHLGGNGGFGGYGAAGSPGFAGSGPFAGSQGSPGAYNGNGGPGGHGGNGTNGTAGTAGQLVLTGAGPAWSTASGSGGHGATGNPGSGGGGGGGGGGFVQQVAYDCNCTMWGCDTCYRTTYYYGGDGGRGANGGGGGTGGTGGTAGGSSFGVYAHNSTITVLDCQISSGTGGNGGPGRQGAIGGEPSSAQSGHVTSQGDGGNGGGGGMGGHGAGGGGGAGGSSIALFLAGTSVYNGDGSTTLTPGQAGQGGTGGFSVGNPGAKGQNGVSRTIYPPPPT